MAAGVLLTRGIVVVAVVGCTEVTGAVLIEVVIVEVVVVVDVVVVVVADDAVEVVVVASVVVVLAVVVVVVVVVPLEHCLHPAQYPFPHAHLVSHCIGCVAHHDSQPFI